MKDRFFKDIRIQISIAYIIAIIALIVSFNWIAYPLILRWLIGGYIGIISYFVILLIYERFKYPVIPVAD